MTEESTPAPPAAARSFWARPQFVIVLLCFTILTGLGVAVTAFSFITERIYTDCQRGYNEDVVHALQERVSSGDLDRSALELIAHSGSTMVDALLLPQTTEAQRLAAVQQWRTDQQTAEKMLKDAKAQRAANPLPAPRTC